MSTSALTAQLRVFLASNHLTLKEKTQSIVKVLILHACSKVIPVAAPTALCKSCTDDPNSSCLPALAVTGAPASSDRDSKQLPPSISAARLNLRAWKAARCILLTIQAGSMTSRVNKPRSLHAQPPTEVPRCEPNPRASCLPSLTCSHLSPGPILNNA